MTNTLTNCLLKIGMLLSFLSCFYSPAWARPTFVDTIKVPVCDIPASFLKDCNNQPLNLGRDLVEHLARKNNIVVKSIPINFPDIPDSLRSGAIDLDPMATYSFKKETNHRYSTIPFHNTWGRFISHANNEIKSFTDLQGKTIGISSQLPVYSELFRKLEKYEIKVDVKNYTSFTSACEGLEEGYIDCFIAGDLFKYSPLYQPHHTISKITWGEMLFSFAIDKNNKRMQKILTQFDADLQHLLNEPNSELYRLKKKHYSSQNLFLKNIHLNETEKKWLAKRDTITLFTSYRPPLTYKTVDKIEGVFLDYITNILEHYDVPYQIEYSYLMKNTPQLKNTPSGVLLGVSSLNTTEGYTKTKTFHSAKYIVIISNSEKGIFSLHNLKGHKVALSPGMSYNIQLREDFPSIRFVTTQTSEMSLNFLKKEKVTAAILPIKLLDWFNTENDFSNYYYYELNPNYHPRHGFEVNNKSPELLSILNKYIASTPKHVLDQLFDKYQLKQTTQIRYRNIIENQVIFFLSIIIVIALIFLYNIKRKSTLTSIEKNLLNSVISSTSEGILVLDSDGFVNRINPVMKKMLGLKENSKIKEIKITDFLATERTSCSEEEMNSFIQSATSSPPSSLLIRMDNNEKLKPQFLSCKARPLLENRKNHKGIVISCSDITENYLHQNDITKINKRLNETETAAQIGWFHADYVNKRLRLAPNILTILNIDLEEYFDFKRLHNIITDDNKEVYFSLFNNANDEKYSVDLPVNIKGVFYWLHVAVISTKVRKGEIVSREGYVQNITSRKLAEEKLAYSEKLMTNMFDHSPAGIVLFTNKGVEIKRNTLANQLIELIRDNTEKSFDLGKLKFTPQEFINKIKSKKDFCFIQEYPVTQNTYEGSPRVINLEVFIKHFNQKQKEEAPGVIAFLLDRTNEIQDQQKLKHQNLLMEEASKTLNLDFWESNLLDSSLDGIKNISLDFFLDPTKPNINMESIWNKAEHSEQQKVIRELYEIRIGKRKSFVHELNILDNQNVKTILFSGRVLNYKPEQNNIHLAGIITDTSIFHQIQNSLSYAQETAAFGNWIYNVRTKVLLVSKVSQKLLDIYPSQDGFRAVELSKLVIPGYSFTYYKSFLSQCNSEKGNVNMDFVINKKDGNPRIIQIQGQRQTHNQVPLETINGIVFDVTKIRAQEHQEKRAREEQNLIFDNISNGVVFLSPKMEILWSNKKASELLDKDVFKPKSKCYEAFYQTKEECQLCPVRATIKSEKVEYAVLKQPNGRIYRITSVPLFREDGTLKGIVESFDDYTLLQQRENELKRQRVKAEESDRLKSAFLANLSHEIRTPLSNIAGFVQLLTKKNNYTQEQQSEFVRLIESNQKGLITLIEDVIDLSKIEANSVDIKKELVNIDDLCHSITSTMSVNLSNEVELSYVPITPSINISVDKDKLTQILTNLISNAKKFTQQGGIWIYVDITGDGKWIEFKVADTGIGISELNINSIFDRFNKGTSMQCGTGLGLSICRALVDLMGGEISVESEKNSGTTFRFTIPYEQIDQPITGELVTNFPGIKLIPKPQKGLSKLNILVAEDNENNFLYIKMLLQEEYNIFHAHDGIEAINISKEENIDFVFMDLMMPNMDGFEATLCIKKIYPKLPIVALTAFRNEEMKHRAQRVRFDDYITKPFEEEDIFSVIKKLQNVEHE